MQQYKNTNLKSSKYATKFGVKLFKRYEVFADWTELTCEILVKSAAYLDTRNQNNCNRMV